MDSTEKSSARGRQGRRWQAQRILGVYGHAGLVLSWTATPAVTSTSWGNITIARSSATANSNNLQSFFCTAFWLWSRLNHHCVEVRAAIIALEVLCKIFHCVLSLACEAVGQHGLSSMRQTNLQYKSFADSAGWRMPLIGHAAYMANEHHSPWLCVPGSRIENWYRDLMHIDFLGVGGDLASSGVVDLLESVVLTGRDAQHKLNLLWMECNAWRRANHLPRLRGGLSLAMLNRTTQLEFPSMSSKASVLHDTPL